MVDRSNVWRMAVLVVLLPMSGCYSYAEVPLTSLSPGVQARLRFSQDGFGRVVNQAAMNGVPVESFDLTARGVVGRVVVAGGETMTLQLRGAGGAVFDAQVPVVAIEESALRRFNAKRTVLAVAGVAALTAATFATGVIGGTTSSPPPPDGDGFAPWYSVPISIRLLFR